MKKTVTRTSVQKKSMISGRRRIVLPIIIGFFLVISIGVIRFVFGGPEDTWICNGNQWVKHGNPSSPMPVSRCVAQKQISVSSYDSVRADLHLVFGQPLYVTESVTQEDGSEQGTIVISRSPGGDQEKSNMTIRYGMPTIPGKGGACSPRGYDKRVILGQETDVCESSLNLSAGYPLHPNKEIEYAFFIGGNGISEQEFREYIAILYSGISFLHR